MGSGKLHYSPIAQKGSSEYKLSLQAVRPSSSWNIYLLKFPIMNR